MRLARMLLAVTFLAGGAGAAETFKLSYTSDPGDPIGDGESAAYTNADGPGHLSWDGYGGVYFEFEHATNSAVYWDVAVAAADDAQLAPGTYLDAERYPFQSPGHPGLDWSGLGTYCGVLTGTFTVNALTLDFFARPREISAAIEQHCNGVPPALHGHLDFDFGGMGPTHLGPDSLLVTSGYLIHEYGFEGTHLADYPILGALPDGSHPTQSSEVLRDVAVAPTGIVYGINGTYSPRLSIWDPASGSWSHVTNETWAFANAVDPGGIAAMESFVFVTNTLISAEHGILRYDTNAASWTQFGRNDDYLDLVAGWDGLLYALRYNDSSLVDKYDPMTMQLVGSVTLETPIYAVAAADDGRLYGLTTYPPTLYRFSASGAIEGSVDTNVLFAIDLDLARDGRIAFGSRIDGWGVTTTSLEPVTIFPPPSGSEKPSFVAFAERGYDSNRIFVDGVESGDTALWSVGFP